MPCCRTTLSPGQPHERIIYEHEGFAAMVSDLMRAGASRKSAEIQTCEFECEMPRGGVPDPDDY